MTLIRVHYVGNRTEEHIARKTIGFWQHRRETRHAREHRMSVKRRGNIVRGEIGRCERHERLE